MSVVKSLFTISLKFTYSHQFLRLSGLSYLYYNETALTTWLKKREARTETENIFYVFLLLVISLSRIYLWLLLLHCLLTSSVDRVQKSAELGKCIVIFNWVEHYMLIWHVVQRYTLVSWHSVQTFVLNLALNLTWDVGQIIKCQPCESNLLLCDLNLKQA